MGDISLDFVTPDVSEHEGPATFNLSSSRHVVPSGIFQIRPPHLANPAVVPVPPDINCRPAGISVFSPEQAQSNQPEDSSGQNPDQKPQYFSQDPEQLEEHSSQLGDSRSGEFY
jgi:hypothetical protein